MTDALCGSMDAAEYENVVLGLIFLKKHIATTSFNIKEWDEKRLREDKRWKFGVSLLKNTNLACSLGWGHP